MLLPTVSVTKMPWDGDSPVFLWGRDRVGLTAGKIQAQD